MISLSFSKYLHHPFNICNLFPSVFLPELASLLMMLGMHINFVSKDVTDFFHNITKQTIEMRKVDSDQVIPLLPLESVSIDIDLPL